jgi:hypothetical protein
MVGEEKKVINKAEYTDKGAKIANCAVILGMLAMLQEAEVINIANIADVLTSQAAAELIEDAMVIEAVGALAGTPDRGDLLCFAGLHSIPGLADSHNHHLTRTWRGLDDNIFAPATGGRS